MLIRGLGEGNMTVQKYSVKDLVRFGENVLLAAGFTPKQAEAVTRVLVDADLRGDPAHGLTGGNSLEEFIAKVYDDEAEFGFRRIEICDYEVDAQKYPTIITVDAKGTLGHYVALEIIPEVIKIAKKYGYAKAYIRNSTHFGDCAIYSEIIAAKDLAAKVTCTSAAFSKPFIELQDKKNPEASVNRRRYDGVKKRFGTNPIAWSIPYAGGIATIDMAATQRAVSPAIETAKFNTQTLGIIQKPDGSFFLPVADRFVMLADLHLSAARADSAEGVLKALGIKREIGLVAVEKGLLKGPEGEDINYPLAYDDVFKKHFWIAPLGGTYFGYKGFGLNMLIELDNVLGGGVPGLIRELNEKGQPTTLERVSQTIEAYAIDAVMPLEQAKQEIKKSIETTLACGNQLMFVPGQKEQETKMRLLKEGIPLNAARIDLLKRVAAHPRVKLPFDLVPVGQNG
jgi:LDH2 family malate/lactate/ureidoglycolate dehydrogenase